MKTSERITGNQGEDQSGIRRHHEEVRLTLDLVKD
jgi:hypothetical protein